MGTEEDRKLQTLNTETYSSTFPSVRLNSRSRPTLKNKEDASPSQSGSSNSEKPKKRRSILTANVTSTRYEVVRTAAEKAGFTLTKTDDPTAYMVWMDSFQAVEKVADLKSYQRINHFPGMGEVCRKDCLARNMSRLQKLHPDEYNFVPKSWSLPSEYNQLLTYSKELRKRRKVKTFIVKPPNGAMGNGIQLIRQVDKIPNNENLLVQSYLDKPFLLDGYKFDIRLYVLVTSCDPLRVFLFNDGLVRMATEKYVAPHDSNLEEICMHLTNYSVNKHSENYEKSHEVDTGSKRSLKYLLDYLYKKDHDTNRMWRDICDMIVKTLIVAEPHLLHAYRMCRGSQGGQDSVCFEVLGFDIFLDKKLKPWLLEINRSPSFGTDEKLDLNLKLNMLTDSFRLLNIKISDKRKKIAAQKLETQRRLLKPTKSRGELEGIQKRRDVERKIEELKEMLRRIRCEAKLEDFENRNCGNFRRIFPPEDRLSQRRLGHLVASSFSSFLTGRSEALQKEIDRTYCNKVSEEELLDMLSQCEADENFSSKGKPGPKPLNSMPMTDLPHSSSGQRDELSSAEDDDLRSISDSALPDKPSRRRNKGSSVFAQSEMSRASSLTSRCSSMLPPPTALHEFDPDREQVLTRESLRALNEMKIKFPGRTDEETDLLLNQMHEDWRYHKPQIASYWLIKLDSIKRRKVIDIVKTNVRSHLQKVWQMDNVDGIKLYRLFCRVFNRLLWSHGQGLWNCFANRGGSWEAIFSKSTEQVNRVELDCCRRVVQLCCDCLLVVYAFATEMNRAGSTHETILGLPSQSAVPGRTLQLNYVCEEPTLRRMPVQLVINKRI